MCMCDKPNVNGTPGAYSWDGKSHSTRQPCPPDLRDRDELLYDEPGRCGGLDCHAHHFRLVKSGWQYSVLVRHGAGDERFSIGGTVAKLFVPSLAGMDSNGRYWLLHTLYSLHSETARDTADEVSQCWRKAAVDGRIKTRKVRGRGAVKVWMEPAEQMKMLQEAV